MFRRIRLWLARRMFLRRVVRAGLSVADAERMFDYLINGKDIEDYVASYTRKGLCMHGVSVDWPCVQCNLFAEHFASDARNIHGADTQPPQREEADD